MTQGESMQFQNFAQCGTKPFEGAGESVRVVDMKIDMVFPEVPFPSNKIYKTLGEEGITKMVTHHHSLLKKSAVGHMFEQEPEAFAKAIGTTAAFFIEALGGEKKFTPVHGHPELRRRHFRFSIDEKGREIWLMMYKKTLKDIAFPKELIEEFWNWIEPLSLRMINRRTSTLPPERFPFETVRSEFNL